MKTLFALVLATMLASSQSPSTEDPAPGVVIVPIQGPLSEGMVALTLRSVREAEASGASHLIFKIDTEGGQVTLMDRIVDAIENLDGPVTVAWVGQKAASAGALIAISCDYLFMTPGGNIGSARPIWISPIPFLPVEELEPVRQQRTEEEEKFISHFRSHFRAKAQRTNRNDSIAEAMVDPRLVLYEVEVDGVRRFVKDQEYRELVNLYSEQRVHRVREICGSDELLNLTAQEAMEVQFIDGIVSSQEELLGLLEATNAPIRTMTASWSESLAAFVQSYSWFFLICGVLGILIEVKVPGFGLPGVLGTLCMGLFLFGKYLVGLAEVTEILLIVAGFVLIAIEVFLVPGTLVAGITGALALLAGLVLSLQSFALPPDGRPWVAMEWWENVQWLGVSLGGGLIAVLLLSHFLPQVPVFNRVMLKSSFASPTARSAAALVDDVRREWRPQIGALAVAQSPLRPAGKILLEGNQLDAVAEGQFVSEGTSVRVVKLQGNRIVVRPASGSDESGVPRPGPGNEGPDTSGPNAHGPDVQGPDVQGPDVQGPDVQGTTNV